ncbi:MAG: hypothetical protein JST87_18505 [Bacteroidetes bacterium]|nr:hypothetical protein [Bacteroidota bacterium]
MALIPKHTTLHKRTRQAAGCKRSAVNKTEIRTGFNARDGFLNHSFLPLAEPKAEFCNRKKTEHEFFTSLKNLSNLFGFDVLDVSEFIFPYNILLAFQHAEKKIHEKDASLHLLITKSDDESITLATAKICNTGQTLYYMPVEPLAKRINQKRHRASAELVLSVFAYLYQILKIPFHTNDCSYVGSTYACIEEQLGDNRSEYSKNEFRDMRATLRQMKKESAKLEKQIADARHVKEWERRIHLFHPKNEWEKNMLACANDFFELFRQFPNRNLFKNIFPELFLEEEDNNAYPDTYISFSWSLEGWLDEQLVEWVNISLQEAELHEPVVLQFFDTPQKKIDNDISFEERIFKNLNTLAALLNEWT